MFKNRPYIATGGEPLNPYQVSAIAMEETLKWAREYEQQHQKDIIYGKKIGSAPTNTLGNILFPHERFVSAWASSLDSALGALYQKISLKIAERRLQVGVAVSGHVYPWQCNLIDNLIQQYADKKKSPSLEDYALLKAPPTGTAEKDLVAQDFQCKVDKYIVTQNPTKHLLVEEKAGGDLDKNKAQAVKRELMMAYACVLNNHPNSDISAYLATAYDKDSQKTEWKQANVFKVFHKSELLIAEQWWNTLVGSPIGYTSFRAGLKMAAPYTTGMYERLYALCAECQNNSARVQYISKQKPLYTLPEVSGPTPTTIKPSIIASTRPIKI